MTTPLADLLPFLVAIVLLSLLMVHAMVRWSRLLITRPRFRLPARESFLYALTWAALIGAFLVFLDRAGRTDAASHLRLMLLAAAGWLAFNLLLVALARALVRAQGSGARRQGPPASPASARDPEPAEIPPPAVSPNRRQLGDALRLVRNVALALIVIALGEALPPLQSLHAWTAAHQRPILTVTIAVAAAGFVLLMWMAIHLVLFGDQPATRQEIEALASRRLTARPALWRGSAHRAGGLLAVGAQGEDSATFSEVKEAWGLRAWRVSPRWRRIFAGLFGVAFLATGLFGTAFALAPAGLQLLLGGALLYAWVRAITAFVRA